MATTLSTIIRVGLVLRTSLFALFVLLSWFPQKGYGQSCLPVANIKFEDGNTIYPKSELQSFEWYTALKELNSKSYAQIGQDLERGSHTLAAYRLDLELGLNGDAIEPLLVKVFC